MCMCYMCVTFVCVKCVRVVLMTRNDSLDTYHEYSSNNKKTGLGDSLHLEVNT